jgi:hypothetical protein
MREEGAGGKPAPEGPLYLVPARISGAIMESRGSQELPYRIEGGTMSYEP